MPSLSIIARCNVFPARARVRWRLPIEDFALVEAGIRGDWYALCYVTPKETCRVANHIGVKDGIIVHRIVASATASLDKSAIELDAAKNIPIERVERTSADVIMPGPRTTQV